MDGAASWRSSTIIMNATSSSVSASDWNIRACAIDPSFLVREFVRGGSLAG
jgi:hypothetical protein